MEPVPDNSVAEIQQKIRALSSRDLQLWSIGLLLLVVLASGFAALIAPNLMWGEHVFAVSSRYLPQLFYGFIALIILFNIYVISQRRELDTSRRELISELMFTQRLQNGSLVDPLTQIFNRRYLDCVIPREIALASHFGACVSFLLLDLDGFSKINLRYGHMAGDHLLLETARLLRNQVLASDTVLRYGGDEFLVILPDCTAEQTEGRVRELLVQVKLWNETAGQGYCMSLSYGIACYRQGDDVREVLDTVEKNLQRYRQENRVRRLRPECLLIGCDEESERLLRPVLNSLSLGVEICPDAAHARTLLQQRRFEALIVDAELALSTDLLAEVRNAPSSHNLILVALGSASTAARTGANFVLEKPLVPAAMARTLRVIYSLMLAERQRYFRHQISMPVSLRLEQQEYEAVATNISEGGMAVRCVYPLPRSRGALLQFALPEGKQRLEASVEITWTDSQGRSGLRFVRMPRQSRAALDRWLREDAREAAEEQKPLTVPNSAAAISSTMKAG